MSLIPNCKNKMCLPAVTTGIFTLGISAFFAFTKPPFPITLYGDTNVACLPSQRDDLAIDWRMELHVFVDDVEESVPANIGNTIRCTTELHTHQNNGAVYVQFYDAYRSHTLTFFDFFDVWGIPLDRDGYARRITFNGVDVSSLADITLQNGGVVNVFYTKERE